MTENILEIRNLDRSFVQGSAVIQVLRGVSLNVAKGEIVALTGRSGSGKSTLLQMAGLLDQTQGGTIRIKGKDAAHASESEKTRLRRSSLGFVYQFHHLLPDFTAVENVAISARIAGYSQHNALIAAQDMMDRVGLADRSDHIPARLSGGEQQRVALARALVTKPSLLLADEPTGNLDDETTEDVFATLKSIVRQENVAALIATHDKVLAKNMDRQLHLVNGQIAAES